MSSPFAHHWTLDPEVDFLNHGSFGACPRVVLERQSRLREELERQPVEFFVRKLPDLLDAARVRLAAFIGADPEDVAAIPNATTGVNSVLRSLRFAPGDELLVTDHEYNACRNALDYAAGRAGVRVVPIELPFPLSDPAGITRTIVEAVTPSTRLLLVDHVTSATGMILPLQDIAARLAERNVDVLVDGAHAPGMLPLDVPALGVTYYTGNCHKWICAPKGAAFLWVRADRRDSIRPLTISHGANSPRDGRSRFHDEFDWMGTDDPTAFLCVPAALDFMGSVVEGGFEGVRRRNRALALDARGIVSEALGVEPPCPAEMIGSLVTLKLPDGSPEPPRSPLYTDLLQDVLLTRDHIEVPVIPWPAPPKRLLRLSAQLYNSREQYERLAAALVRELG
jgi:isopenicillin-N epimerase